MAKAEMALILSLVDEVSKTAKNIKEDLGDVGKEAQGVKGGLAKLGGELGSVFKGIALGGLALATTAIVGIGTAAFAAGMKVDDAMDTIAISTGATGDELAALGDDFSAVFTSIPVDAETAAGVIGELNKTLGISGDELVDLAKPLAEASRMLGTDATASAKTFAQAMNAWKVEAADAPGMLDMLFTASQKSGVGFDTLLGTVTQFGPQLRTMGYTLEDSVALLSSLEKSGVPASIAMSGLQKAAGYFAEAMEKANTQTIGGVKSLPEAAKQLDELQFQLRKAEAAQAGFNDKTKPIVIEENARKVAHLKDKISELSTAMELGEFQTIKTGESQLSLSAALQDAFTSIQSAATETDALTIGMEIFGAKGAVPMVEAIRSGKFSLEEMTAALQGTEGAIMNTAAATADFPEKLQVLKNKAADALAPIGVGFMDIVTKIVEFLTPAFEDVAVFLEETVAPAFDTLAEAIGMALGGDVQGALELVFGAETTEKILGVVDAFGKISGFLKENWEPIIAGLGAAAAIAFTAWAVAQWPAVAASLALAAANAPIILGIAAIAAAVGLLVKAWQEDWGGIRTFFTEVWEEKLQPAFETMKTWLETNLPIAIETLSGFWTGTLQPAVDTVVGFFKEDVIPLFEKVRDWLETTITAAIQTLSDYWTGTLKPAVETVVNFFNEDVVPLFEAVGELFDVTLTLAITALSGLWENVLLPALTDVWNYLNDNVFPIFEDIGAFLEETFNVAVEALSTALETLGGWLNDTIAPALKTVWEWLDDKLSPALETVKGWFDKASEAVGGLSGAFDKVTGWIQTLKDKLANLNLPDWLTPGSPTPLEIGLWGIAGSIAETERGLRGLDAVMAGMAGDAGMPALAMPGGVAQSRGMDMSLAAGSARGGGVGGTVQGYSREALRQLFETMAAAITMPLASALAERMQGNGDSALGGTLRALEATV